MRKGINISHVNIEIMGVRDQSQVKIKFKKFEKIKSIPTDVPKSHIDDRLTIRSHSAPRIIWAHSQSSKKRFGKTSFHH